MSMRLFQRIITLLSLFVISGCLASNADPEMKYTINVETLYSDSNCGNNSNQAFATLINSQDQFYQTWQSLHSMRLGGKFPVAPKVDFTTHNVLLIQMGRKNSGGYRLELAHTTATLKDKIAIIHIDWIEPKEGSFVIQALTSPCLLLKIERGDYQTIQVRDKSGKLRITAKKP